LSFFALERCSTLYAQCLISKCPTFSTVWRHARVVAEYHPSSWPAQIFFCLPVPDLSLETLHFILNIGGTGECWQATRPESNEIGRDAERSGQMSSEVTEQVTIRWPKG
jgi:hypothetical protein